VEGAGDWDFGAGEAAGLADDAVVMAGRGPRPGSGDFAAGIGLGAGEGEAAVEFDVEAAAVEAVGS
jgi:hypothetical protein